MKTFSRNHITYFGYFVIAFFAFNQMGLGPIVPYLRDELNINYAQSGLYVTMFAAGMIINGFVNSTFGKKLSRKVRFYNGFIGLIVSLTLFLVIRNYISTLIATFLLASFSTNLLISGQSLLSDNHGSRRDTALTEANICAATTAIFCPLLLGLFTKLNLGWRTALVIPIAAASVWFITYIRLFYQDPPSESEKNRKVQGSSSELLLYIYCAVAFFGVACEWGFMFWAPQYIEKVLGFSKSNSSFVISLIYVFFVAGRFIGSKLTAHFKSSSILLFFIALSAVFFPLFWLESFFIVNFIALSVISLCLANFFPLTLSVVMGINPEKSDKASSIITIAAGSAILSAPFAMGMLGDRTDLKTAYLSVAGLIIIMALFSSFGKFLQKKHS